MHPLPGPSLPTLPIETQGSRATGGDCTSRGRSASLIAFASGERTFRLARGHGPGNAGTIKHTRFIPLLSIPSAGLWSLGLALALCSVTVGTLLAQELSGEPRNFPRELDSSKSTDGPNRVIPDALAEQNRWLLAALNGAAVVSFLVWWRWMGRRPASGLAPPGTRQRGLARYQSAAENEWRDRALAAEARVENATALVRTRLVPSMARSLMSGLVQRLLLHRSDLLNSQQRAEQEVAELEQRLENLHTPLAGRLAAYEQRIAELEKELAAKGEENRELLRARIATARRKLVSEREREPVPLED